jgi:hypothetical protein
LDRESADKDVLTDIGGKVAAAAAVVVVVVVEAAVEAAEAAVTAPGIAVGLWKRLELLSTAWGF